MSNYLDGFERKEVTLNSNQNSIKGSTVSMATDYTVKLASSGDAFIGVCTYVNNYTASVLLKGFVEVPYTGEAPACGYNKLSANGSGGVKTDTTGRDILVVCVDKTASTCGIIL